MSALSEEHLDELRATYAGIDSPEAKAIVALLGEVDAMDDALHASENEVESLQAQLAEGRVEVARLRGLVEPKAPSASISRTTSGKWAVRWRADGKQLSRTFERRAHAEMFRAELCGRWRGGAL
ncbi:hypothetical protein ACFVFS_17595 [Kitasatospora sp. NPDC057692]|uniref:hypothetical protein n=1 Tax=Kitasatospora sp. NPDC057692 TaxID=3346215 RepID=UPI0036BA2933